MDTIIQKAAKGNRTALTQLYESNKQAIYFLCRSLLQDGPATLPAAKWALKSAFQAVERGEVQTEAAFFSRTAQKAAAYCKKDVVKRDDKAFRLPPQKNCRLSHINENGIDPAAAPADNYIQCLPAAQRFALVLRLTAGMSDEQTAQVMGISPSHLALLREAEPDNLGRVYRALQARGIACIAPTAELLTITFDDAVAHTHIPEELDQHIYGYIDACAAPAEKQLPGKWAACAVAAVVVALAVLLIAIFSSGDTGNTGENGQDDSAITSAADDTAASDTADDTADDVANDADTGTANTLDSSLTYYADIKLQDYGTVTVALDQSAAPATVANFVELAESGFYDGLTFHRIIDGFMMQGGDPNGNGTGGSEETIVGEFTSNGYANPLSHTRGAVSMARSSDYDSASSQFFIVQADSTYLDGDYAVFGTVTEGMDIVDAICESAQPTDSNGSIAAEEQPVITTVAIRTEG